MPRRNRSTRHDRRREPIPQHVDHVTNPEILARRLIVAGLATKSILDYPEAFRESSKGTR
jgi:hypothetical protein